MSGGAPAALAPLDERMTPTLNAFSTSIATLERIYADGTKGVPMVLDGDWQHFQTVKARFVDKCEEFGKEEYRSTDNKPADLTTPAGKLWVRCRYAVGKLLFLRWPY